MNTSKSLDKEPIRSLFFKYYFPALTSMLAVTLHQVINAIILAKQVGKEGVTAVGLFGPVFTLYIAFALALMIGGGILVGKNIGAKNYDKAQSVFQFTTTVALIFSVIIALNASFLSGWISAFLGGDENESIVGNTFDYLFWAFLWMPFFLLRMLWGNLIANDFAPHISRNANIIAVCLNIILDILLVIVFPYGVAGASIATGISIVVSWLYLFWYIHQGKGHLSFKNFRFTLVLPEWKQLLAYGTPTFLSEIAFALGLLVINHRLTGYGASSIAAFGIINHLSFIFLRLFTAAMVSALPIMSFNIGAKLPARVFETLKFSVGFTIILGIAVSILGFALAAPLVHIFSGDETDAFQAEAVRAMGLYFALFIAAGPNYILAAYLQSIGKTTVSSIIHVAKGLAFVSVFAYLLPGALGVDGIWLSRSFTEIVTLVLLLSFTLWQRERYFSPAAILQLSSA